MCQLGLAVGLFDGPPKNLKNTLIYFVKNNLEK
jgi:hypothetical protein